MPEVAAYADEPETPTRQVEKAQSKADQKLLKKALACFQQSHDADKDQRKREVEDLEFDAGQQWPKELLDQRGPTTDPVTGRKMPGRPSLTIPTLDGPVYQVINQQAQANLGITVKPKSGGATQKTAERINGLIRHIQNESRAQVARGWAYQRAVKCGRGYYRILKDWANDGDFDVDLIIEKILNQSSVYLDPFHKQPDASDIEWAFIVEDLSKLRMKREHGDSKMFRMDKDTLRGIGDQSPGWVTFDGEGDLKAVRRAEYWYVVYEEKELVETTTGWVGLAADQPPRTGRVKRTRTVKTRSVRWVKMTATEILDREEWEGRYIPIVQVLGREYNVNGTRIYKGIITNAKDAGRSYNYMRSKQVEAVGLAPIAPYVMEEGQDENYEDMWATANTMPYSALKYKGVTIGGQPAPPPQRNSASTDIGAITIAAHAAREDIDSITGFSDPARGRSNPADRSGRAIQALQQRTDQGTSDYLDNLSQISMVHEGRILVDMLPFVYDREGRIATLLDEDLKTSSQVMLNTPFVTNPKTGEPRAARPGEKGADLIDLRQGVYRIVVAVGKSFKTQRDESVALLGDLIEANPQVAPLVTDVLVDNVDAPGFSKLSKRFRVMLPQPIQQMEASDTDFPPAAAAQIAMQGQQLQQQGQQMQSMQKALEEKQAEAKAKQDVEQYRIDRDHELKMAELAMKERVEMEKLRAGIAGKTIEGQAKQSAEELRAVTRRVQQEAELRHDAISQDTEHAHERAQTELEGSFDEEAARIAAAAKTAAKKNG